MDLDAYLRRIDHAPVPAPDLAHLRSLHRAHLVAVPFENLDIHVPTPIVLDEASLFDKLVTRGRGGFCYEQNGLFAAVLRRLGYDVDRVEAQVYDEARQTYGMPRNHMALVVRVDGGRWLADVGFGASFIEPLPIDEAAVQRQDVGAFRVDLEDEFGVYRYEKDDTFAIGYRFRFEPLALADYDAACRHMQTSPDTHFTQKRLCSRWSARGRLTVSEGKFIETALDGTRRETPIPDEATFHALLVEHFGVEVRTRPPVSARPAP